MGRVWVERQDGWARIWIDNPAYRNCLGRSMWDELREAARHLSQDPALRVVIVQGVGGDFTSGYDLSELAGQPVAAVNQAFREMEEAIAAVESLPVPVVAAVQGYCLGGGFELALACDLRWVSTNAKMGMPVAKLGIMLSRTFAWRLVRAMGPSAAKELLFTGRILTGEEALKVGAANRLCDPGALEDEVMSLAAQVSSLYPNAVRQAKSSVGAVIGPVGDDAPYFVDAADFARAVRRFER